MPYPSPLGGVSPGEAGYSTPDDLSGGVAGVRPVVFREAAELDPCHADLNLAAIHNAAHLIRLPSAPRGATCVMPLLVTLTPYSLMIYARAVIPGGGASLWSARYLRRARSSASIPPARDEQYRRDAGVLGFLIIDDHPYQL